MKILTSRNGIALIGVLTILLILTLLLPAMFTMSDTATKLAVQGEDRQKASYFARSLCEMAVATFKNTYAVEVPEKYKPGTKTLTDDYAANEDFYDMCSSYQAKYNDMFKESLDNPGVSSTPLTCQTVTMYMNDDGDVQYSNEYNINANGSALNPGGNDDFYPVATGTCSISYLYQELCYLVDNTTKTNYEIKNKNDFNTLYLSVKNVEDIATTQASIIKKVMNVEDVPAGHSFTVTKVMNKIVSFDAEATLKGKTEKRKCVVILPTYPAEQNWLLYPGDDYGLGNEVVVNPDKATGMTQIDYNNSGIQGQYKKQNLLTYSCLGNMKITTNDLKEGSYTWNENDNQFNVSYVTSNGISTNPNDAIMASLPDNATQFVMDVAPGINTTPNNDPDWNILDGINMRDYYNQTQADNFIALAATNSITVELPITLMVNPARANRLGDGTDACYSLYKALIFQAPTVVFGGQVDMMVSFYDRPGNGLVDNAFGGEGLSTIECRRMSSVILTTPEKGGYRYTPDYQDKSVKAGRAVFLEDCYVWVIDYADNGSSYSEHWYETAQTVYYKNKDFTKIKVASAGDVYLYNTELKLKNKSGQEMPVGFSISGYAIETIYYEKFNHVTDATPWYSVWKKTQQALFNQYIKNINTQRTYQKDDFHLVANLYDGSGHPEYLELPDGDGIYTIWSS